MKHLESERRKAKRRDGIGLEQRSRDNGIGLSFMLIRLRQRLSTFRQKFSPIASLVDFSLWILRFGLPPWRHKFWLVMGVIVIGVSGAIFMSNLRAFFMMFTSLFVIGVILVLMLSYFRTFMSAQFATLEQTGDRLTGRVAESDGLLLRGHLLNLADKTKIDAQDMDGLVHASLSRLLESDFMAALTSSHDQIRKDVTLLQMKLNQGHLPQSDLTLLRAELTSLQRRTERQLRLDSSAIAHLTAQLDELTLQSIRSSKTPAKRRAPRPHSV